ncbi:MAG: hypothetical protein L0G99_11755, partial [Propionibacteriales bacterium]|nr:hypothetical protein [Propionibacteriales bacterium]
MSTFATALRLSGLAAIALLAEPLTGLADTIAAGRLGVEEQSSLALGASIATTATWLVAPIMFAQTTEIATLRATGRDTEAARTTGTALLSGTGFGFVLGAILAMVALFAGLTDGARDYLLARAAGLPVMAFAMAGYGALRGSKAVHSVSLLALSGAAVHIGLDIVSVLGTSLGLAGLGLASVAAQLLVAVLVGRTLARRGLLTIGSRHGSRHGSAWRRSAVAVLVLSVRAATLGMAAVA